MIWAVEGGAQPCTLEYVVYSRLPTKSLGISAAFGSRLGMTHIEEVKKQAKKRKEFSQFVLAFLSFGSPVAWNGTRRC
jgi:hypothetical protein